jgi:hypothetical protein
LGSNTDEGTLFNSNVAGPTDDAGYQQQLKDRFGSMAADVAAVYPVSKYGGDFHKRWPRWWATPR